MAETSNRSFGDMNSSFICFSNKLDSDDPPCKIRKYQMHTKTYSPKWELDPNYRGWVQKSKRGGGFFYCLACNKDYTCGKSELDKHASSKKHCLNLKSLNNACASQSEIHEVVETDPANSTESFILSELSSSPNFEVDENCSQGQEESFGKFIINELKRIKKKKTYELVKWEILQTLQNAMLKEVETEDSED